MPGTRLYVGGIGPHVRDRDVERFFKGYGRLRDVLLKNGYGFVEFEDHRDADDAIYELNGRELMGQRVSVEAARGPSRRYDDHYGGWGRSGRASYGGDRSRGDMGRSTSCVALLLRPRRRRRARSPEPEQDLKDYMRQAGEVTYADAHKNDKNEGVVEFASYRDMKYALEKLDDTELNGRRIKLIDDSRGGGGRRSRSYSRSRSRSRSRRRSHSRSRSRSRSRGGKRSKDCDGKRDSRSKSKDRDSRSKSKDRDSRSKSKDRDSRSKSKDRDSRSKSKDRDSRSKSNSKDREMNGSKDRSRSGSVVNGADDKRQQDDDHVEADAERKSEERRSKSGSPDRRSGSRSPAPDNGRTNGSAPDDDAEEMEG